MSEVPEVGPEPAAPKEAPTVRRLTLSPSRAGDFKTCPLLYRLRAIDRIAEPPSLPALRGTLVHAALEKLFAAPPAARTEQACVDSIGPIWATLCSDPAVAGLLAPGDLDVWLAGAQALVRAYFRLEDPASLRPEACELAVEVEISGTDGPVPLKGFIDRVDVSESGRIRIVDYKSGRSPSERYEVGSLYQLKFYALMLYRLRAVVPDELKLIYLADRAVLRYQPDLSELLAFERGVIALWQAIRSAVTSGSFPPNRSAACRWCSHRALCPEFGGTPPPMPDRSTLIRSKP